MQGHLRQHPLYDKTFVSRDGLVFSSWHRALLVRKPTIGKGGYHRVGIRHNGKTILKWVHHLVMETFLEDGRPKGRQCAHLDGDPSNNSIDNLAWVTPKKNQSHRKLHGTYIWGEDCYLAKLNVDQVKEIRKLLSEGFSGVELAKLFNTSTTNISAIKNGRTWCHIEKLPCSA